MKKLYYFSQSKLKYIEIKNYKAKLSLYFSIAVIVFSSFIFGGYNLISYIVNPSGNKAYLKKENKVLKNKLLEITGHYSILNKELDSLSKVNNDLRVAANLPPVSKDESKVGVGGGYYDNSLDFLSDPTDIKLKEAYSLVDEVTRKINFEKANYLEISKKIKENKILFAHIPAIRPCVGTIGDGFGMRLHPILHIWRMHEGLDFVANIGTPVYATGDGVVEFVGYKGGYGLTVEIDHGFGYKTIYGHLSKTLVKEHKKVKRGDLIAKSGNTGLSTGPHLHYEVVHNGVKQNPIEFFFNDFGFFELTNKN